MEAMLVQKYSVLFSNFKKIKKKYFGRLKVYFRINN